MKKVFLFILALIFTLPMAAQTRGMVKREGGYTNVRSGPGTYYSVVRKIRDGSTIYYTNYGGGWCAVYSTSSPRSFIGYMASSKIVRGSGYDRPYDRSYDRPNYSTSGLVSAQVVREGGYTNIRRGPGSNYGIVKKVRDGSWITIRPNGSTWIPVYQGGRHIGYIHASKVYNY